MAIQNNDDQNEIDYDYQDFQHSVLDAGLDEPVPEVQDTKRNPLKGRRSPGKRKGHNENFVDESAEALEKVNAQIKQICDKEDLNSRDKTELIKYVSRTTGFPKEEKVIIEMLGEHHQEKKYGATLPIINSEQGIDWFTFEPVNILSLIHI